MRLSKVGNAVGAELGRKGEGKIVCNSEGLGEGTISIVTTGRNTGAVEGKREGGEDIWTVGKVVGLLEGLPCGFFVCLVGNLVGGKLGVKV